MNLEKYNKHLFQNIKGTLAKWFDSEGENVIPNEDVYRFLHSIKGTAGTLELNGLMQTAEHLMQGLHVEDEKHWDQMELQHFLSDLMELTYECEHFNELGQINEIIRDVNAPLIQIVDDDVSMLMLLKDVLEEQGWMVIAHTNPEKAVNEYFDMQPDCLILDICLPEKDGFQVLQDLQQHSQKYFIPVIMISIQNDRETRIKAFQMGADDFISKPIDIEEFIAKMNHHIQRKNIFDESVLIDKCNYSDPSPNQSKIEVIHHESPRKLGFK